MPLGPASSRPVAWGFVRRVRLEGRVVGRESVRGRCCLGLFACRSVGGERQRHRASGGIGWLESGSIVPTRCPAVWSARVSWRALEDSVRDGETLRRYLLLLVLGRCSACLVEGVRLQGP